MNFRVLIEVGRLPDGEEITKRTGEAIYTVRREVKFFGSEAPNVKAEKNVVFLADSRGNFNAIESTKLVLWETDIWGLQELAGLEETPPIASQRPKPPKEE